MAEFPIPPHELAALRKIASDVCGSFNPAAAAGDAPDRRPRRATLSGLYGSSAALVAGLLCRTFESAATVVLPDEEEALAFRDDLEFFLGSEVPLYPALDPRTSNEADSRLVLSERLSILARLPGGPQPPPLAAAAAAPAVVMPVSALLEPLPSAGELERGRFALAAGMRSDPGSLRAALAEAGFQSSAMVTSPGEFSLRGGILDLFPMGRQRPLRVEFLDDVVESLREFDLESQRSTAVLKEVEIPLPPSQRQERSAPFGSLVAAGVPILVVEPDRVEERLEVYARELAVPALLRAAAAEFLRGRPGIDLARVPAEGDETTYQVLSVQAAGIASAGAAANVRPGRPAVNLRAALDALTRRCGRVIVLCQVKPEADRLRSFLREQGISTDGRVAVATGRIAEGFQFPAFGLCAINHHELFERLPVRRLRRRHAFRSKVLESFQELKAGDFVVHLVHGIGRFEGLARMERETGGEEEFMVLMFQGDVVLYVPASKIHLVHRYIGSGDAAPELDRIGSSSWNRRKEKVAGALEDLAADMLETEAARSEEKGFAFPQDDEDQAQFDASFPFEETEDQVASMAAIKEDMQARRPMDRLLCGDVGFGKTELAVRAAFKAVFAGKQVAVLVPTTILAQQHFETFSARMSDYPVRVEVLSRFQRPGRQAEIARAAREGKVDVLIGTHRLLSRDVGFKDLGLLVIDEEQRFGVRHKERLKRLKKTVDVLTMTATPIPRTLHMALVGIRDISSLETPPEGRMSVRTMVEVRSDDLIRRALLLEASRGGQAFYLHNRVETIEREARSLRKLVPDVRIAVAHGRMRERDLQETIDAFVRRKIDALVCTTIIESGIDMPGVNTMIVDRADTFGLADLHQLRGRVGRGSIKAYCYLLIPHRRVSPVALRRLKAIEELSYLGAGFNIALKDLEIRGAGNILGVEQHGHIAAVGYDLYCRLLKATILRLKGEEPEAEPDDVDLDIQVRAYLPPYFVPDDGQRIEILRRLSEAAGPSALGKIEAELKDRFGPIPIEARRLIDVFMVRRLMIGCGIRRFTRAQGSREVLVELHAEERYRRTQPLKGLKLNPISPDRAVLVVPAESAGPDELLILLKTRLMAKAGSL